MSVRRLLEICVDDPAGVAAAIAGGADRIELCASLATGGLTPSLAAARDAVRACGSAGVRVHAIVRPRAGNFIYDGAELEQSIADACILLEAGVDGLVFGAARDGVLDGAAIERWVTAVRAGDARPALTLHRAIDVVADPVAAVETAIALGFDRILTSGGAATAIVGRATIAAMVAAAAGRCTILPGSGIRPDNVAALLTTTGAIEAHASASSTYDETDPRVIALGFAAPPRRYTDTAIVRALRSAIDQRPRAE